MSEKQDDQAISPDIGAYNDAIAHMYDKATAGDEWSVNDRMAQVLRNYSGGALTVLDLGAGTGQTVSSIIEVTDVSRMVAVDASTKMLARLREKYPMPFIEIVNSTIEGYVKDNSDTFDIITAVGSLEFVKDLPSVLGRLALRLRPNGLLVATYIQRGVDAEAEKTFQIPSLGQAFTEYYWSQNDVNDSLTSKGLTLTQDLSFPAYERGNETVEYNLISAMRLPEE